MNWTLRQPGLAQSTLVRKVEGRPAREMDNENLVTPAEFARLMELIVSQKAAWAESCNHMIRLLAKQQNGGRIGRYVSRQEGVRWGSKTGTSSETVNDVGFIQSERGVVLSVFGHNLSSLYEGEHLVGEIARAAMVATGIVELIATA